ncbi:LmbU family transcriptional regulator [Actinocorallia sp. B10E7]|uniref:LmbU family transcriptional regulator n=1 Tax=Actinocorallia sp. B10E7 TaxID=3153558 RepID=UPI00325D6555
MSLHITSPISLDSWLALGEELFVISDASAWWLGDWLVYGQDRYPDRYRRALEETSLQYKTLRNYAWVARKFPASRRRDTLSLQHHAEVAALSEGEQDTWLNLAERHRWSVSELRRWLKAERETMSGAAQTFGLELDPERFERWRAAADLADLTLEEWISTVLDHETETVLAKIGGSLKTLS